MCLDELLNLKVEHINFHGDHMTITLPYERKNEQMQEGNIIHMTELGTQDCPVSNTIIFIRFSPWIHEIVF